jgi:hypothetical protein
MNRLLVAIIIILLAAGVSRPETAFFADEEEDGTRRRLIEEVTTEEVKRFLDPTRMISRLAYDFQMSFLPGESELMTQKNQGLVRGEQIECDLGGCSVSNLLVS